MLSSERKPPSLSALSSTAEGDAISSAIVVNDTSTLPDLEKGKTVMTTIPSVQSHNPEPVLRIIDIGFDGLSEPSIQAVCLEENDLEHVLDSLPTQNSGTARIFVSSFPITREPPGNSVLLNLESFGLQNVKIPKRLDVSDLSQLAPQWQDKANPACFGIKLHSTDDDLCAYVQCIPFGDDKLIGMLQSILVNE